MEIHFYCNNILYKKILPDYVETIEQFKNNLISEDNNYNFKNIFISYYVNDINYKPKNEDILFTNIKYYVDII